MVSAVAIRKRQALMLALAAAFLIQSWLVYTDPTGADIASLSGPAQAGKKIWNSRNCQACHQVYGFGGFLGPDLTNAAPRHTIQSLQVILAVGPGQMPSFDLSEEEVGHLYAYLRELDRTGTGQAKMKNSQRAPSEKRKLVFSEIPWFEY